MGRRAGGRADGRADGRTGGRTGGRPVILTLQSTHRRLNRSVLQITSDVDAAEHAVQSGAVCALPRQERRHDPAAFPSHKPFNDPHPSPGPSDRRHKER
jgi:hypothetical protein